MRSRLRVLVEKPTRGKRWVAIAADWPGLERGGMTEDEAVQKLDRGYRDFWGGVVSLPPLLNEMGN